MKRVLVIIGIILLMAGVMFKKEHQAEMVKQPLFPKILTEQPAAEDYDFMVVPSNFSDHVDLWGDPWVKIEESDLTYASLAFRNELKSASVERFQPRPEAGTEPVLSVLDRQVAYSLFQYGNLKLKLNFKPAYPNPEALLPTRIDPSISGSFSF